MTTGTPFVPTALQTSVVAPSVTSAFRRTAYISNSEYIAAPTAVGVGQLFPGGTEAQQAQSLADTIMRASGWMDEYCFHSADGSLAASPSTEQGWIKPKPDGSLALICKYRPILELISLAVGSVPSQISSLATAPDASFGDKVIYLPATADSSIAGDLPTWPVPTAYGGTMYCVWQYVNGFPTTTLATAAIAGATSLSVSPALPGGTAVYGVYPGTALTIHDGPYTETVVVSSVSNTTLTLQSGLVYAHTPPASPDAIRVSALPWALEQACISLTSCLIKLQGTGAMVMPPMPGGVPSGEALIQAGGLQDFEVAQELLAPFRTVFAGHA